MKNVYETEQAERAESVKRSEKDRLKYIKLDQPIDLRFKYKKGLLGKRKQVPTTEAEQRKLKKAFMLVFPDNLFIDNLYEKNSVLTKEQKAYQSTAAAWDDMLANDIFDDYFDDL